ncbi:zinc ribbon domain-containing protein [Sphingobacterium sp. SRCM116780]|uniref:zinc ribbon domain-containing protein n=1 Tax=Sphingobacterium sp. SRCM116780 TaxID=2907623 RepID=UPI001F16392B|nr:zinc ribbon domain-containing protein [Sphingobacterium sp. SRCM116780]UIR57344.1 zinc ribbon domain-containing protein [Sphingobacterium sp. SRCM116780]
MVHGYYTKLIRTKRLQQALTCPHCGSMHDMQLEVFCTVNHIIFIPFFSDKKTASIGCAKCGSHYNPTAFAPYTQEALDFARQAKMRWYHFTGLALLLIFATSVGTLIFMGSSENKNIIATNFENLKPNCAIYYSKAKDVNTSMLVSRIVGDTVFVHENKRSTNRNAYYVDDSDNYYKEETYFLKSELKQWLEDRKITDVSEPQTYGE